MLTRAQGTAAVRLARWGVVHGGPSLPGRMRASPPADDGAAGLLAEARGVFVTLRRHPSGALRGCIGFPRPLHPLRRAIPEAAWSAANDDPRFPAVAVGELDRLTVEVSILTEPQRLPTAERRRFPEIVVVGRDGLIVEGFGTGGLLLPQVATEQGWDSRELLAGLCEKAGLPSDAWLSPEVRIYRFGAEIAQEQAPGGAVLIPGAPGSFA